jgi:hypothetical protein
LTPLVVGCEFGGQVGPATAAFYAVTWLTRPLVDRQIIAADQNAMFTAVGTQGDPLYTLGDGPLFNGLFSQFVFDKSCSFLPLVECTPAQNNKLSACDGSLAHGLNDHGLVKNCPNIVDLFRPPPGSSPSKGWNAAVAHRLMFPDRVKRSGGAATPASGTVSQSVLWPGEKCTIKGTGFGKKAGKVTFTTQARGATNARVSTWTRNRVTPKVPKKASTGPIQLVTTGRTPVLVGEVTILPGRNSVSIVKASQRAPIPLQGNRSSVTATVFGPNHHTVPGVMVGLSDGLYAQMVKSGPSGQVQFTVAGYQTAHFVVYSGRSYSQVAAHWRVPPKMSMAVSAAPPSAKAGEPGTVAVTLRGDTGQPEPNQVVTFYGVGGTSLKLSAHQAKTNNKGAAGIIVTDDQSENVIIGVSGDDYTKTGWVRIAVHT